MLQKYTAQATKPLRWHDGETGPVGPNSILETDTTNIVMLGGVSYIAIGSQVNVLINTAGPTIGIGETSEDLPVKTL
jgi:hypothetical protein